MPGSRLSRALILFCAFLIFSSALAALIANERAYGESPTSPAFSSPINLSLNARNASNPDIWNVGTHLYVAWAQSGVEIAFRESPDGGATWYPPLSYPPLSLGTGGSAPLLSANGSNVYIVWPELVNNQSQIIEATSTNYGESFSTVQLTSGNESSVTPVVASWGNNVYVGWAEGENSYVSCSNSSGAEGSWTTPYMIGDEHEPQLAAWGGQYVYAVSDAGLYVSSDNCNTWQFQSSLQPWGAEAWIWAYGPNVYAASETKGNSSRVYYTYSNNYGANWTQQADLTRSLQDAWAPMIWAYNNSAWIAVHTFPGGTKSQVYVYSTNDSGANWSGPIALSAALPQGDTSFPFTVTSSDGQNVFVAWAQQLSPGYWQLDASYSNAAGGNWTAAPGINASQNVNGTQASNNSDLADAAIASYGSTCYAVWQYIVGSTSQILFASTSPNAPSSTTTSSSSSSTSSASHSVSRTQIYSTTSVNSVSTTSLTLSTASSTTATTQSSTTQSAPPSNHSPSAFPSYALFGLIGVCPALACFALLRKRRRLTVRERGTTA